MKTRTPSAAAEPSTLSDAPDVPATVTDGEVASAAHAAPDPVQARDDPASQDPRDHDGDGRMGGVAPPPESQPLVVLRTDASRGLVAGEVVTASPADAGPLLMADVCRNATDQDVELASPRIRRWAPG